MKHLIKPEIKAKLSALKAQLKADEELRLKDPRRAEILRQARWKEDWHTIKTQCKQLNLL